ncbi:GDSL-type esterase/lipase family protein [Crossiella sp. CA198]|uniref:GDSL-type esterase/lipase family protein n=1 Tax=Crossiella sp. CA198 TaxID=3455607 RepID=UPI003F8D4A67
MPRRSALATALLLAVAATSAPATPATAAPAVPAAATAAALAASNDFATVAATPGRAAAPPVAPRWLTSWAQSQHALAPQTLDNQSIRMIAHLSQGGRALRIRVQNEFGTTPLTVNAAAAGISAGQGAVAAGTTRPVRFNTRPAITIPPHGEAWSDPVPLPTRPQDDVAVSLFVSGQARPGGHQAALRDNYLTPAGTGNRVADPAAYPLKTGSTYLLSAVDVLTAEAVGTVVAYGSSVVDGHGSTVCGPGCTANGNNRRWTDDLARRTQSLPPTERLAVANAGVGGTTSAATCPLTPPQLAGLDAQTRLDRDIRSLHGVTAVIYYYGTNDLAFGCQAGQILDSYRAVFTRLRAAGLKIHVVPITPRPGYSPQQNQYRAEVNNFIRAGGNCAGACDSVIDFDQVLRDPANPNTIRADYDSGDGIHANQKGHEALARSVPLPLIVD